MLLSRITVNPSRFQLRDTPFSEKTVIAIVAEGIDPAKFDPIPLIDTEHEGQTMKGRIVRRYCVAGDGHSRLEAIERLRIEGRGLPAAWRRGGDLDIPHRIVTADEARTLSWTANLSRDDFTACEEAKVFQAMVDSGLDLESIGTIAHRSASYVRSTLPLNALCRDIRLAMSLAPDAGGIDAYIGKLLAAKFQQYGIGAAQQHELWHKVLKHADLTASFVRSLIDRLGQQLAGKETQDVLFAIPASVSGAVADLKDRAQVMRRADLAIKHLLFCQQHGVWDDFPDLARIIATRGESIRATINAQVGEDASLIAKLCCA